MNVRLDLGPNCLKGLTADDNFYLPNWESTCTFEIGKIAHAKGMSPSVEDTRGESTRGGEPPSCWGVWGVSPRKFLKFRMQESASETIFQ